MQGKEKNKENRVEGVNLMALMILVDKITDEFTMRFGYCTKFSDVFLDIELNDDELRVGTYRKEDE